MSSFIMYSILVYLATSLASLGLSLYLWYYNKKEELFKWSALYWTGTLLFTILHGAVGNNHLLIAQTFIITGISHLALGKMMTILFNLPELKAKPFLLAGGVACLVSFGLSFVAPFWVYAGVIALAINAPNVIVLARAWKSGKENFTPATRLIFLVAIFFTLHQYDFPFLRLVEWFAPYGFGIANLIVLGFALTIPMSTIEKVQKDVLAEQKKNQQLVERNRESLIGIAAGFAHEINTPLAALKMGVELVTKYDEKEKREKIGNKLAISIDQISGLIQIVKQMPDSRTMSGNATDLNSIDSIQSELKENLKSEGKYLGLTLVFRDEDTELYTSVPVSLIKTVLTNLIQNAVEAQAEQEIKSVTLQVKKINESQLEFRVSNKGQRLEESFIDEMYLPFKTTKPIGGGFGLGLTVAKNIVENFSGNLVYEYINGCNEFCFTVPGTKKVDLKKTEHLPAAA